MLPVLFVSCLAVVVLSVAGVVGFIVHIVKRSKRRRRAVEPSRPGWCRHCDGSGRVLLYSAVTAGRQKCWHCDGTGGPAAQAERSRRRIETQRVIDRVRVPRPRSLAPPRFTTAPSGPQPRERWWVDVPHEDDPSTSKQRPCLVLGYSGKGYWVLKCTTREPKHAEWRVPVNRAWWRPSADKDSFVDLQPYHLPKAFLRRKLGVLYGDKLYRRIASRVRWDRAWDFID